MAASVFRCSCVICSRSGSRRGAVLCLEAKTTLRFTCAVSPPVLVVLHRCPCPCRQAFDIVPSLCPSSQLSLVLLRICAEGPGTTLDQADFSELLTRLGLYYMPGWVGVLVL
jgi:hypothetical protein